jgi:hypothetical protein
MPFRKSARITVTNESDQPCRSFYYYLDWQKHPTLPTGTAYFHAMYRQEHPCVMGRNYLLADIHGRGHYVGTIQSVYMMSGGWYGEGDDFFFIDGEAEPSLRGTGTEDYFCDGWGLREQDGPFYGAPLWEGMKAGDRGTAYRFHLTDPVVFTKSLRVEIEHKGWMSADETTTGKVEGHVERDDDFATVAFWYQQGQPKRFAELPPLKDRKLPEIDTIHEGKELLAAAKTESGAASLQGGDQWTGEGQVFFQGEKPGAWLELRFDVATEEFRRLVVPITRSYDFGIYRILLDGKPVGDPLDLYSPKIEVHEQSLGDLTLSKGEHVIRLECTGKNPLSSGCKLGVDSVRLRQRWNIKRPPLGPPK